MVSVSGRCLATGVAKTSLASTRSVVGRWVSSRWRARLSSWLLRAAMSFPTSRESLPFAALKEHDSLESSRRVSSVANMVPQFLLSMAAFRSSASATAVWIFCAASLLVSAICRRRSGFAASAKRGSSSSPVLQGVRIPLSFRSRRCWARASDFFISVIVLLACLKMFSVSSDISKRVS